LFGRIGTEAVQEHHELGAAEPRDHVVMPHAGADAVGALAAQEVAHMLALGVVQYLEVVEIDEKQLPISTSSLACAAAWIACR
jgi:hypothetical protein